MLTLGADPELFLVDASDAYISSIGKIGGSKRNPRSLPLGNGFAVQEDNVAVEYNIPPATTELEFKSYIEQVQEYLSVEIRGLGLKFSQESSAFFDITQLKHPRATKFGCEPDFNAWLDGAVNPIPKSKNSLRTAGGHVHIGCSLSKEEKITFIKHLDLFLGVPSVILDVNGHRRRELYGNAGAFRFKKYGVEYRTLSNFWIFDSNLISWVWNSAHAAYNSLKNIVIEELKPIIIHCISNNDRIVAENMIKQFSLPMP